MQTYVGLSDHSYKSAPDTERYRTESGSLHVMSPFSPTFRTKCHVTPEHTRLLCRNAPFRLIEEALDDVEKRRRVEAALHGNVSLSPPIRRGSVAHEEEVGGRSAGLDGEIRFGPEDTIGVNVENDQLERGEVENEASRVDGCVDEIAFIGSDEVASEERGEIGLSVGEIGIVGLERAESETARRPVANGEDFCLRDILHPACDRRGVVE